MKNKSAVQCFEPFCLGEVDGISHWKGEKLKLCCNILSPQEKKYY